MGEGNMRSLIIAWLVLLPVLTVFAGIKVINQVSYGEIIAIAVSIVGGLIVFGVWFVRRRREKKRIQRLVSAPDTWTAIRRLDKEMFVVKADIDVLLKHNSFGCELHAKIEQKPIIWVSTELIQPHQYPNKGRWRTIGETPLSSIPRNSKEVEVWVEKIEIDGEYDMKSRKRKVPITDEGVAPLIPDKEASQS